MLLFSFQGKSVIRPIAFRPTPGPSSGASTPTNGYVVSSFRPPSSNFDFGGPHPNVRASPATSMTHVVMGGVPPPPPPHPNYNNEGFAPGHPLIKDGRRHYGSKLTFQFYRIWVLYILSSVWVLHTSNPDQKLLFRYLSRQKTEKERKSNKIEERLSQKNLSLHPNCLHSLDMIF